MGEEERALTILKDLGFVKASPDPEELEYDPAMDDEECNDYEGCFQ